MKSPTIRDFMCVTLTPEDFAELSSKARYDAKLTSARDDVIKCARKLSNMAAEFDGDLQYCSEYLDALWGAIDCMEAREKDLGIR